MGTERKPWKISPGDPSRPGVTGKGNRYNFAVDTRTGESPELLFYRDGREEQRILLDETYRTGRRYAVMVEKPGLHQYEYRYRQGEITFTDPAARLFWRKSGRRSDDLGKSAERIRSDAPCGNDSL